MGLLATALSAALQEHEQLVTAAYLEKETARQEAARAKADREARYAWAQLLSALRKRMQLANDYGNDTQEQNTTSAADTVAEAGEVRSFPTAGPGERLIEDVVVHAPWMHWQYT